ncbi:MAG: hypothetical protein KAI79_00680 [Bacteroidales bacterium]|nr:hypothetical protein [Bacteroidales bacterium]
MPAENTMKLTKFDSAFTSSKVPVSPFGDKTFIFNPVNANASEFLEHLRTDFILNRNYDIKENYQARRTKRDLHKSLSPKLDYVILDLDSVKTKYAENQIIEFFKKKDYYVGIIPSRNNNGIDNFNLKGFVRVGGRNNTASIRACLEEINQGIYMYTKVDMSAIIESSYQAPTYSKGIMLYQEGSYIPEYNIKQSPREHISIELDKSHDKVVQVCLDEYRLRGFHLEGVTNDSTLMTFSHPSEKTRKGYFCYINNPFYMNHFNSEKSFNIFDAVKNNKEAQKYFEKINKAKRIQEFSSIGQAEENLTVNARYLSVNAEIKTLVSKWFNTQGLLKIKSAMGTGKSTIIDYCIQDSRKRKLKTLLVTNRISVAQDFKSKYGIKMYSDGTYEHGDDLIVQYDSLWKYSLKHFDVVILDEYVSLILHTRNTMGDYGNLNKTKLMYAMESKTCLIADAFLFGLEDNFIGTKPKYCINNTYREEINVYEYEDVPSIFEKIIRTSTQDKDTKKVSVSCTTKATAEAINEVCIQNGLKTMMLSSDTLDAEKDLLYKVFEQEWHDYWDVLIYTPTLTVGVSILNNTDNHFHIDESNSADVVSSLQMIRRARKATGIHFMVAKRRRFLETRIETLNKEINDNIQKYYKKSNSLLVGVDEHGDFHISKTGEFINKIEILYNKLEINHQHSFELLLKHQIQNEIIPVQEIQTKIDVNKVKKSLKEKKLTEMKEILLNLEPLEYDESVIEEYKQRNYLVGPKDRMLKLISDVKETMKPETKMAIIKDITQMEINKKFKFIAELKRLKLYLTKNESNIKNLLSYIVGENMVDKNKINYFNYILSLKRHSITLKNKLTSTEIQKVNAIIGYGDFTSFLKKVGYKKRGNVYYLGDEYIKYSKFIK